MAPVSHHFKVGCGGVSTGLPSAEVTEVHHAHCMDTFYILDLKPDLNCMLSLRPRIPAPFLPFSCLGTTLPVLTPPYHG